MQTKLDTFCGVYKAYKLLSVTSLPQSGLTEKEGKHNIEVKTNDKIWLESLERPFGEMIKGDKKMKLNTTELKDCREFIKEVPDNFVDLIVIDPPYNELPKDWDKFNDWENLKNEFNRVLKRNGQLYVFGKQPMLLDVYNTLKNKFEFRFELVWDKGKGLWSSNFRPMQIHELIWCFKKRGVETSELCFDIENIKTPGEPYVRRNIVRSTVRNNWALNRTIVKDGRRFPTSIFRHPPVIRKRKEGIKHPTEKPLELLKWIVKSSSKKGDIVLDCFMGSGTTAVACIQLGRNFIGCEINKDFYEAAEKRILQETGAYHE